MGARQVSRYIYIYIKLYKGDEERSKVLQSCLLRCRGRADNLVLTYSDVHSVDLRLG